MFAHSTLVALLPVALLSLTAHALPPQVSFTGCTDAQPVGLEMVTTLDALPNENSACSNYCRNNNYLYSFYREDGPRTCGCRFTGLTATEWVATPNDELFCEGLADNWFADITWTTFGIPRCYASYNPSATPGTLPTAETLISFPTTVNDLGSCFRYCVSWGGASLRVDGDAYICQCDADGGDYLNGGPVDCAEGTIQRYGGHIYFQGGGGQDTGVQPPGQSVWVKRQLKDQVRLDQQKMAGKLCPGDARACLTAPGASTWECVETDAELESCGGCLYGDFGDARKFTSRAQDCTSLAGVRLGGVTCEHGQCAVWACDDGFKLVDRTCVPITSIEA